VLYENYTTDLSSFQNIYLTDLFRRSKLFWRR